MTYHNSEWPEELFQNDDSAIEYSNTKPTQNQKPQFRGLRVRMGIHYGAPIEDTDPITSRSVYYGPEVHIAAQVEKIANGGQILAT